jgi:hypothetical protein
LSGTSIAEVNRRERDREIRATHRGTDLERRIVAGEDDFELGADADDRGRSG